MMENRISEKLNAILSLSKEEAERMSSSEVMPEHILLGMMRDGKNKAVELLSRLDVNLTDLRHCLESLPVTQEQTAVKVPIEKIVLSEIVTRLIKISILEARLLKKDESDAEHMLLAIVRDRSCKVTEILSSYNVDYRTLLEQLTGNVPETNMGMGISNDDEEDDFTPA